MASRNQTPEQKARDNIDAMLEQAGWKVQPKKKIDFNAGPGIVVREYDTDVGPASILLERIKAEKTVQANARKLVRKRKPRRNVIPAKAGIQNKTSA